MFTCVTGWNGTDPSWHRRWHSTSNSGSTGMFTCMCKVIHPYRLVHSTDKTWHQPQDHHRCVRFKGLQIQCAHHRWMHLTLWHHLLLCRVRKFLWGVFDFSFLRALFTTAGIVKHLDPEERVRPLMNLRFPMKANCLWECITLLPCNVWSTETRSTWITICAVLQR